MNCQEFDKNIQPFIDRKLDYNYMEEFVKHYRNCKECRDELEIHVLTSYVLQNEEVTSINLEELMKEALERALEAKKKYYRTTIFQMVLYAVTDVIAVLAAYYFFTL